MREKKRESSNNAVRERELRGRTDIQKKKPFGKGVKQDKKKTRKKDRKVRYKMKKKRYECGRENDSRSVRGRCHAVIKI